MVHGYIVIVHANDNIIIQTARCSCRSCNAAAVSLLLLLPLVLVTLPLPLPPSLSPSLSLSPLPSLPPPPPPPLKLLLLLLSAPARPRSLAWWLPRSFHYRTPAAIAIVTAAAVSCGVDVPPSAAPPLLRRRRCSLHAFVRLANKTCPIISHQQTRLPQPLATRDRVSTGTTSGISVPSMTASSSLSSCLVLEAACRSLDECGIRCVSRSPWAWTVLTTRSKSGLCGPCPASYPGTAP